MKEEICIRIVNENLKLVEKGEALTLPLSVLNQNCYFKKRYDALMDIKYGDLKKQYYQKPEVKQRVKEYKKEYSQKPEVKQNRKEYQKEYQKEYRQKLKERRKLE